MHDMPDALSVRDALLSTGYVAFYPVMAAVSQDSRTLWDIAIRGE